MSSSSPKLKTWRKIKAGVYEHVPSGICVVHTRSRRSPWGLGHFEHGEMVIGAFPSDGFRTLREGKAHVERTCAKRWPRTGEAVSA